MTKYLNPTFNSGANSQKFVDNWERTFGKPSEKKMTVRELERGAMVVAVMDLDPAGANVKEGTYGVVFEPYNYHGDGGGPMVRWVGTDDLGIEPAGGCCNVYANQVMLLSTGEVLQ